MTVENYTNRCYVIRNTDRGRMASYDRAPEARLDVQGKWGFSGGSGCGKCLCMRRHAHDSIPLPMLGYNGYISDAELRADLTKICSYPSICVAQDSRGIAVRSESINGDQRTNCSSSRLDYRLPLAPAAHSIQADWDLRRSFARSRRPLVMVLLSATLLLQS